LAVAGRRVDVTRSVQAVIRLDAHDNALLYGLHRVRVLERASERHGHETGFDGGHSHGVHLNRGRTWWAKSFIEPITRSCGMPPKFIHHTIYFTPDPSA